MTVNSRWAIVSSVFMLLVLSLAGCQARNAEPEPASDGQDLLAIKIPKARVPFEGMLTGGQPTPEQLEQAAKMGFQTVINMRPVDEKGAIPDEADIVADLGMQYVYIPVKGAEDLTEENATRFAEALAEAGSPLMIHCASGNRVGALFALKAVLTDGASVDEAMQIGVDTGVTRLESSIREILIARQTADTAGGHASQLTYIYQEETP